MIGAGWFLDRRFKLDLDSLVKLNFNLFVPVFIFVKVVQATMDSSDALTIIGFTACVIASMSAITLFWGKLRGYSKANRRSMQMATMFYNCGNFGIPVTALAYPDMGPKVQVFALMAMNVSVFSIGLAFARKQGSGAEQNWLRNILSVVKQPPVYGVILAIPVRFFDVPVMDWQFIWKPLEYIAGGLVAIATVTLGVQLSKTKPVSLRGGMGWAVAIRLLGGPLVGLGLVALFGFSGEFAAVLILGTASPTAVNTALLAHEFKGNSQFAAGAVFYSTLFSVPTVAILATLLKYFYG
ncbi:AEC family transporter [Verrucomicrobia bacterium]|nr:AEC family transporter [Verrucomicrobiota bacterium]